MIISLAPLGENNKIETFEADLNALLQELKYPTVASLKIGHHSEEPKSSKSKYPLSSQNTLTRFAYKLSIVSVSFVLIYNLHKLSSFSLYSRQWLEAVSASIYQ